MDSKTDKHGVLLTVNACNKLRCVDGATDIHLDTQLPASSLAIVGWEQRFSAQLPNDLKMFYLAHDGLTLTWSLEAATEKIPLGEMKINSVGQLKRIGALATESEDPSLNLLDLLDSCANGDDTEIKDSKLQKKPQFNAKWKVFELDSCRGWGKVCLAYAPRNECTTTELKSINPTVWFLDRALSWNYLAPDFSTYYRMMLYHLGLPQWQYLYTPHGLSPEVKKWFYMILPSLVEPQPTKSTKSETPLNKIDEAIFRSRGRSPRKERRYSVPKN